MIPPLQKTLITVATALCGLAILAGNRGAARADERPAPKKAAEPTAAPIVWTDLNGNGYGPTQLRASSASVFIFVSTECPLARVYAGRIRDLEKEFFGKRVRFFLVDAHQPDTAEKIGDWARERNLAIPLVKDVGQTLTDRLGATRTPEAVLVDRGGKIVYRGSIDDNKDPQLARKSYLRDALTAVLSSKPVPQPRVGVADGCLILKPDAIKPAANATITYAKNIAPLLNKNCVSCHRKGEVAPFTLDNYEQARLWAPMLADVAKRRIMPPWKATPGYGDFHDTRSLTDAEVDQLTTWAKSGAPSGDLKTAPKPPTFSATWAKGEPDLVVKMEQPYTLAAEGKDLYRCFVLPVDFKQDTYITMAQVRPGNRSIVHHIIVYIDKTGTKGLEMDAKDPEPGFDNLRAGAGPPFDGAGMLTAWAPGNEPIETKDGIAVPVPKGARIIMEVHYHRSGQAENDQTELGLTFARETVRKFPYLTFVVQPGLSLAPGDANARVHGKMTVQQDMTLGLIAPHMHQTGKEMHVWATKPTGEKVELIYLKNWDFQWQTTYSYREPISLPKGTKIEMDALFDNSESNPRNPNRPPKPLTWGEASTDEMCLAFLGGVKDNEQLTIQPSPWKETAALSPEGTIQRLVEALRTAQTSPATPATAGGDR